MRMTRVGGAFAACAVLLSAAGVLADYPELILLAAGAAGALAAALGWVLRRPFQVDGERSHQPRQPFAGQTVEITIQVTNTGTRAAPALTATDTVGGRHHDVALPGLAPGARATASYDVVATRRGRLPVSRTRLWRTDPLGLLATSQFTGTEEDLRIHPRWYPGLAPMTAAGADAEESLSSAAVPHGDISFHSLREYQPGDPLRLIHWRTTAKLGVPAVRHQAILNDPHQLLILDTDAAAYPPETFEEAVRVAASLAVAIRRAGLGLDLRVTRGDAEVRLPRTGWPSGDHGRALDLLSDVQRHPRGPALADVLAGLPSPDRPTVLGVVAGRVSAQALAAITAQRRLFQAGYLVTVGTGQLWDEPPGVRCLSAATCEDFVAAWRRAAAR